jgi:two-component system, NtrC family, sensor histidine kinase GlrK
MRWLLPKSLNGYLLLGIGVITVPLLIAILHATIEMRRLTSFSQRLVLESVQTTRLSQNMFEQISSLERAARLYQVLGEPKLLAAFDEHDNSLATTIGELRAQLHGGETRAALEPMAAQRAKIAASVHAQPAAASARLGLPDFGPLGAQASLVATLINVQIDANLSSLREQTETARRELFWESGLLLPLALAATLTFALGVSRPMRQVDRAIGELGGGNLARAIAVKGPVDLQRLGQQLEWLRGRLLELAQDRNRFLRHMSHELKTPLANIREGTELLMDGAVGELGSGQREVMTILQDNSIKLQRMIENLLSFSAWQSNSMGLELSEFRLRPLVKQVLENQQLTLVSQRVRLDVQIEDLTLTADRGKLRLILENLLSNAIKYSPRGGAIVLRARALGESLQLEVADSGNGIAPAERASVFEAFHTGRSPGGHVRGTGIGLSVVHEFVAVHRGVIEIIDGEFPGAHFRIRIPLRGRPAIANAEVASTAGVARRKAHAA